MTKQTEIKERMKLIEFQMKADKIKHDYHMQEMEYQRATELIKHEKELERGRIRTAEIRRTMSEKNYQRGYN